MLGIVGGIADITENVLPACLGTGWSGMPKLPSPKTQIVFICFVHLPESLRFGRSTAHRVETTRHICAPSTRTVVSRSADTFEAVRPPIVAACMHPTPTIAPPRTTPPPMAGTSRQCTTFLAGGTSYVGR